MFIKCCISHLATVNPLAIDDADLPDTIWRATLTIELPHAAPAPLNPSSVPNGFVWFLTFEKAGGGAAESKNKKIKNYYFHIMYLHI